MKLESKSRQNDPTNNDHDINGSTYFILRFEERFVRLTHRYAPVGLFMCLKWINETKENQKRRRRTKDRTRERANKKSACVYQRIYPHAAVDYQSIRTTQ